MKKRIQIRKADKSLSYLKIVKRMVVNTLGSEDTDVKTSKIMNKTCWQ